MLFNVKTLDELSEAISKANQLDHAKIVVDADIRIGEIDKVKQSRFEDITASMEIDGGGHILQGEGIGIGLVIKNSKVKICNLTIAGFSFGLWVEPEEQKPLGDIELRDCIFQDMAQVGVVVGGDNSNTGVDGMLIENCVFDTALSDRKETPQTGTRFVMILGCSILTSSGKVIRNNFLKNITVRNCKTIGSQARKFDGGMFVVGSYDLGYAFLNQEEIAQYMMTKRSVAYWVYAMSVGGEAAGRGRCENCRTENIIVEKPELDYGRQLERKEFYRANEILIENGSGINNHAELVFIK